MSAPSSVTPRPVVLLPPTVAARPIIVEVPHAGTAIPPEIRPQMALGERELSRDADLHVHELYRRAPSLGATLLYTEVSRFVVDLNRAPDDVDRGSVPDHPRPQADAPRGLVWRVTTDGTATLSAPLSLAAWQHRVSTYHAPYHRALDEQVAALLQRFGKVLVLSGHSMPSVGKATHADPGKRRADVVPGDVKGKSCDARITAAAHAHFAGAGLSVAENDPYQGGETTRRLGAPARRVHALQVELNRDLYLDERALEIRRQGFDRLELLCGDLVDVLARVVEAM